jgi:hypothetical protein
MREQRINRLPPEERTIARLKALREDKDEAAEFEFRKTEHIERNRTPIARVQGILEKWQADETTPMEWIVQAQHTLQQLSHPDADIHLAGVMVGQVYELAQDQRDQQVAELTSRREQLEAMLANLAEDQLAADAPEVEPSKRVKLVSTELSEQAEELLRTIAASPSHSTDETFDVLDAVRAHRAGNSGPISLKLTQYVEQPTAEAANDSNASE